MKKILTIVGPTATGKTDLAIDLAKQLGGELVSVDSRQVYKWLDLGTGKLPGKEVLFERGEEYWVIDGVKVWLYDICSPQERYHVSQYAKDAKRVIEKVEEVGKLPILVGGTGFYLRGLLEGFPSIDLGVDEKLREKLEKSGVEELQKKLVELSPAVFEKMNESDRRNPRRLIRQIEIYSNLMSNENKIATSSTHPGTSTTLRNDKKGDVLKIGLTAPRSVLNERIDRRVLSRFELGMLEEAKKLLKDGLSFERMKSLGLEYRVQAEFLNGEINYEEMVEKLQNKIHQYAKRQMTWFKKDRQIEWFYITEGNFREKVERRVLDWYNADNGK